jgi:hypothetical protein
MKVTGTIILQGDYGSPTGAAKLVLPNLPIEAYGDTQTKLSAFAAAIKAAGLTSCNVGDLISSQKSESSGLRPDDSVNVKEKLYYGWRTEDDSRVRRGTISGVPKDATIWEEGSNGDELNAASKTALEAALNSAYGLTTGHTAIVLWGKNKE